MKPLEEMNNAELKEFFISFWGDDSPMLFEHWKNENKLYREPPSFLSWMSHK